MQIIKEGQSYNSIKGVMITVYTWGKVDKSFEPSGHWHDIYSWVPIEQWLHPYDGSQPIKLI